MQAQKNKIENAIELIKVVIWPITIFLIIILFWTPLKESVNLLPHLINKSEIVSIGSLSIKVSSEELQPNPEVKRVLKSLSNEGLETLITSGAMTSYFHESELLYAKKKYKELIELGLFTPIPLEHLSIDPKGNKYSYGVQPTQLAEQTVSYVLKLMKKIITNKSE